MDAEFGPDAEVLLASPPSPIHMRLMIILCALVLALIVLAAVGHIDIYAVAPGRIQPAGRSKVIQPLETGRIIAVHVINGTRVKQGDLLVELDPTESAADRAASAAQLESLKAEAARRLSALAAAKAGEAGVPEIRFDAAISPAVRAREQAVLAADLSQLRSEVESVRSKIAEVLTRQKALHGTIAAQEQLVSALRKRVEMREALVERQLGAQANVIDAQQELGEQTTILANQKGDLLQTESAIPSLKKEQELLVARFIGQNTQALATAQARSDELAQNLVKASARVGHTLLTAPITGTVQELSITTIGQVVAPGQHLMTLVPESAELEAEALVSNSDIGFVEVGQRAVLKIDTFPFTRYGTLTGTISRVSHDAVYARDALAPAGSPTIAQTAEHDAVRDFVFPVTVVLDRSSMTIDGRAVRLVPGMSAQIEIRTGERRLGEFFFSPLVQVVSEAARER